MNLSSGSLAEVLFMEALCRDDVLAAAGHLVGARNDGHTPALELVAQLCSVSLRLGRLHDVLQVLPFLGLQPEELLALMRVCQSSEKDPTARFLQFYEASILQQDRVLQASTLQQERLLSDQWRQQREARADARLDWVSRQVAKQAERMAAVHVDALLRACFLSWALGLR